MSNPATPAQGPTTPIVFLPGTVDQQPASPTAQRPASPNTPLRPLREIVGDRLKLLEAKPEKTDNLKPADKSAKVLPLDTLMKEAGIESSDKVYVLEVLRECRNNPGLQLLMYDETSLPFPETTCRELADINSQLARTERALGEVDASQQSSCSRCLNSNAFSYSTLAFTAIGVIIAVLVVFNVIPLPPDVRAAIGIVSLVAAASKPAANAAVSIVTKKQEAARKKAQAQQRALTVAKQAKLNEGRVWICEAASGLRLFYVDAYPVPRQAKRGDFMNRVYKAEERTRFEVQQKMLSLLAKRFVQFGQPALLRNIAACTQMKEYTVNISDSNSSLDKDKSAALLKVKDHQFQPESLCEEFMSSVALICENPRIRVLHTTNAYQELCRLRSVQECELTNANARAMHKDAARGGARARQEAVGDLPDDQETQAILEQFPNSVGVIYKRLGAHKRAGSVVVAPPSTPPKPSSKTDSSGSDRDDRKGRDT